MALQHESTAPYHVVQYALRVLDVVARYEDGVTDAELAAETGLPAERLTALLRMLRREGYVEQIQEREHGAAGENGAAGRTGGDGAYVVGATLRRLGTDQAPARAVRYRIQQTLDRLRDVLGAAVYLSRYIDGEVRITQYAAGPGTPKVHEWVDFRSSAHASAVGKSLLGQLDVNGRRDHLSRHRMARLTSRTITSERVLLSRLAAQPPTVPVLDLQEYAVGTVCAAVPVTAGAAVGCLALSLPVEHAHRLRAAARTLNRGATPLLLSLTI